MLTPPFFARSPLNSKTIKWDPSVVEKYPEASNNSVVVHLGMDRHGSPCEFFFFFLVFVLCSKGGAGDDRNIAAVLGSSFQDDRPFHLFAPF